MAWSSGWPRSGRSPPEIVSRGIAAAALRHALLVCVESTGQDLAARAGAPPPSAAFSSPLIGTNGGQAGQHRVRCRCHRAGRLAGQLHAARTRAVGSGADRPVELVELYEDIAARARHV